MVSKIETCDKCKWAIFVDYGYSNYTVEGTNFICGKNAHPDGTFDRFYNEDYRLHYAHQCIKAEEGDSLEMDCDRYVYDELTEEEKTYFDAAVNG